MSRLSLTLTAAPLALALAAAPASAQLLGGGLGIGGTLNGAIGSAGIAGDIGAAANVRPVVRVPPVAVRTVAVPPLAVTRVVVPAVPDLAIRSTRIVEAGIAPVAIEEVPGYVENQYVLLRDDLRGTGVEVIRRANQIVLEMPADVTFAFDKSDIQPRFRPVLDAVSHTLGRYPATFVDVDGHTDAIGSLAYNQRLSERRAGAVADYLADRSVNPARMHVAGFGKTEPIASNATVTGRAANRRVEIVLTPYVQSR